MAREVFAHVMLQFPISNDNQVTDNDYMARNWMVPAVEGATDWRPVGGYLRERTMALQVGEHPDGANLSVARPLSGSDYSVVGYRAEIRRMKALGIQGAMPDIQQRSGANYQRLLDLCAAAVAENFKIMLCPDMAVMTTMTSTQLSDLIQAAYAAAGNGSALKRAPNGNILIAPYLSAGGPTQIRDASFWNSVQSTLTAAGMPMALLPVPNSTNSTTNTLFESLSYTVGEGSWGDRNPGTANALLGDAAAMRSRKPSYIWAHPISARDARYRDEQYDENYASLQTRTTCAQLFTEATGANDIAIWMTWNDHSEHSGVTPTDKSPDAAFAAIGKRYTDAWRTGQSSIATPTQDTVHVIAPRQVLPPVVELNATLNSGTAYTSITVKTTTQYPTGYHTLNAATRAALTAGAKLHTRDGQVITVASQPAVNASTISINSFTPSATVASGSALTKPIWTYVPPIGNYKPSVNRGSSGGSTSCTKDAQIYEILSYLTAPGDITVTDAGGTQTMYTAPAGEFSQVYPAVAGMAPTGVMVRSGVTQLQFAAGAAISATPTVQDHNYYTTTTSNPPTTPTTPQVLPSPTRILLARDTAANLATANSIIGPGEVVIEQDTERIKIGDNTAPYLTRPYLDQVLRALINPDLLAVGETITPFGRYQETNSAITNSSGSLRLTYFTALKSQTVTQIRIPVGNVAASGLSLCRLGLYTVATNGDLTRVATTANNATLFASTGAEVVQSLSASYDTVAGVRYALGVLQVGTTPANLCGSTSSGSIGARAAREPRLGALLTGQTDLPASVTSASLSNTALYFSADLLP